MEMRLPGRCRLRPGDTVTVGIRPDTSSSETGRIELVELGKATFLRPYAKAPDDGARREIPAIAGETMSRSIFRSWLHVFELSGKPLSPP